MNAGSTEDSDSSACCCSASLGSSLLLLETFTRYCQSTTFNLPSTQHMCVFNTHTARRCCIVLLCLSSYLCSAQCDCLQVLHHRSAPSCLLILPSRPVAVKSHWTNHGTALKTKPEVKREHTLAAFSARRYTADRSSVWRMCCWGLEHSTVVAQVEALKLISGCTKD